MPLDCFTDAVRVTTEPCVSVVADVVKVVAVDTTAGLTWIESALDVEEAKLAAPEYMAVIVSVPAGRLETATVADPLDSETDAIAVDPL